MQTRRVQRLGEVNYKTNTCFVCIAPVIHWVAEDGDLFFHAVNEKMILGVILIGDVRQIWKLALCRLVEIKIQCVVAARHAPNFAW